VQDSCTELDQPTLNVLHGLSARGVPTSQYSSIDVGFTRDLMPELRRGVVLRLYLPKHVFMGRACEATFGKAQPMTAMSKEYLHPRVEELPRETYEALVRFCTTAVRQSRMEDITDKCARDIIPHLQTSGDLLAVWPGLIPLLDHWNRQGRAETWRARFRNPPSGRKLYGQETGLDLRAYKPMIDVADMVLLSARMMPSYKQDESVIRAAIVRKEIIEGDIPI
jgi:hypothetical protein